MNEASKRNEALQREVAKLTDEWTAEKQRHARTKQSYAKLQEQYNHNAVARLQPARLHNAPLSPLQSPASAPSHAPQSTVREHFSAHSLPPAAGRSPMAVNGAGWGSSSHGSLEYAREADGRALRSVEALSSPYHAQLPSGGVMPTHLPSGQAAASDSRRRQLPLHAVHTQQPGGGGGAAMSASSSEQQRYQRERQVHGGGSGVVGAGAGGSAARQAQHTSNEQRTSKRGQQQERTSAQSRAVIDSWLHSTRHRTAPHADRLSACCVL